MTAMPCKGFARFVPARFVLEHLIQDRSIIAQSLQRHLSAWQ